MKIEAKKREVTMSGGLQRASFGISTHSQVFLIRILRDTLYKNKILAVERETTTNAWDAHRSVGKEDVPIKVVLPTELEASFIVRDWGPGLRPGHPDEPYELRQSLGPSMFGTFIFYGDSTKRDADLEAGTFGIGAKSPFAYNDSFAATSWHGGLKRVFHAVLDESDMGEMVLLHEAALGEHLREFLAEVDPDLDTSAFEDGKWHNIHPWLDKKNSTPRGNDLVYLLNVGLGGPGTLTEQFERWMGENYPDSETGIEIKVPVSPGDVPAFHREARNLFPYFRPIPDINIPIEAPKAKWRNDHGWLSPRSGYHSTPWVAVMGCVPYKLDLNTLEVELKDAGIAEAVGNLAGGLYFDIGEVDIVASREELEYKPRTRKAIVQAFINLLQSIAQEADEIIQDGTLSEWERHIKVHEFVGRTQIPLTGDRGTWGGRAGSVTLYSRKQLEDEDGVPLFGKDKQPLLGGPDSFVLQNADTSWDHGRRRPVLKEVTYVAISENTRLLVRDTLKPWRGYAVGPSDRVVTIKKGHTVEQVLAELDIYIEKARLKGVPVFRMSQIAYTPFSQRTTSGGNQKHSEDTFYLKGEKVAKCMRLSDNWDIVSDHTPDQDDVFVILDRFAAKGFRDFFDAVTRDREILKELFGEEMPTIVGYKSTQAKPVREEDVEGIPYKTWRKQAFEDALGMNPEIEVHMAALAVMGVSFGHYSIPWSHRKAGKANLTVSETYDFLRGELGGRHRIPRLYRRRIEAQKILTKTRYGNTKKELIRALNRRLGRKSKDPTPRIFKIYPLLRDNNRDNNSGLSVLSGPLRDQWLIYIKAIDATSKK
jgi:hypothetical protein